MLLTCSHVINMFPCFLTDTDIYNLTGIFLVLGISTIIMTVVLLCVGYEKFIDRKKDECVDILFCRYKSKKALQQKRPLTGMISPEPIVASTSPLGTNTSSLVTSTSPLVTTTSALPFSNPEPLAYDNDNLSLSSAEQRRYWEAIEQCRNCYADI